MGWEGCKGPADVGVVRLSHVMIHRDCLLDRRVQTLYTFHVHAHYTRAHSFPAAAHALTRLLPSQTCGCITNNNVLVHGGGGGGRGGGG
jgi:hypothetical protein